MTNHQPRLPRIRRKLAVRFGTPGDLSFHGLSVNLSSRGIGLSSQTILPAGTPVVLEISLASGEQSRVAGVVVWSSRRALALSMPGTMGIRIDAPDHIFLQLLSRMLMDSHDTDPALPPVGSPQPEADWWLDPDTEETPVDRAGKPPPSVARVPRFFEQVPIRYGLTSALNLRGFTENISRTGIAISCATGLSPNDTVLFALTLPDERLCHGTGTVMWSRLGRNSAEGLKSMGIRITRVERTFRELLEALARRH